MDAQTLLRTGTAKVGAIAEALGDAAEAVAKVVEVSTAPLAEKLEDKAGTLAKSVEKRAAPLAKSVEERAAPVAEAVETTVDALVEDLGAKMGRAREEMLAGVKDFKFGPREGLILGAVVGIFAAVWLIRKIDRRAAAEKLRVAGARMGEQTQALSSRVGGATHDLSSRVGGATHELADKAGALANQAGERVGQVVQQIRDQTNETVEGAKLRLSDPTSPAREIIIGEAPKGDVPGSGLDKDTQQAINEVIEEVERIENEALEEAGNLGLSNGMKVVAFDGTDLGRVQEVREDVFVLNRPKGADLLVPLTEVARIEGTVAYLRIDVGQVPKMGWENA